MANKTRKHIWSVPLVASIAIIGVLAAFVVLANNPSVAMAQAGDPCAGMTDDERSDFILDGGACGAPTDPGNGNGNGNGNGSDTGTSNQGTAQAPSVPMNVDTVVGDGKLTVTWQAPRSDGDSPITGYMVEYKPAGEADAEYMSTGMLPASAMKYVIMGLENETRYHVRVKVMNRVGSTPSGMVSKTPLAVPSMPLNLALASHGGNRIAVSWEAPSSEGDSRINRYRWALEDGPHGYFGSKAKRDADPATFDPDRGGAITAAAQAGCHVATAMAYNDDNNVAGDVAMATCPSAPMNFTKQVVDNVAILRWERPARLGSYDATVTEYVVNRTGYERSRTSTDDAVRGAEIPGEARMWTVGSAMTALWDTGLSHQTIYEYTIFAVTDRYDMGTNSSYYMEAGPLTAFTSTDGGLILAPPSPPTAPRSLETMDQCDQQITLSWMAPSNFGGGVDVERNREWSHGKIVVSEAASIEKYDVQYRERGRGAWMDLSAMGTEAAVTSDLEFGKTYDFRVRAKNNIGLYGPWASTTIALVVPPGVNAPSNLRATLNEEGEVVLQWTAPHGGNQEWFVDDGIDMDVNNGDLSPRLSYRIERVDAQNNDTDNFGMPSQMHQYGPRSFDTPRITHEQTRTDPDPYDGEATYVVTALVHNCLHSEGNSVTLDTQVSAPGTPGNVSAAVSGSMITVTWTAPSDAGSVGSREASITGYNVERSTMSGSGFETVVSGHSGTSYTDSGLDYDTTYYYRVIAVNSFGATSEMSAEATATTAAEIMDLTAPSGVAATSASGVVSINWSPADNATSQVVIAVNATDDTDFCLALKGSSDASHTCPGLTAGTAYVILVIALDGQGGYTLGNVVTHVAN